MKTIEMVMSVWFGQALAVGPAVDKEGVIVTVLGLKAIIFGRFIQLSQQQRPAEGRLERGHQQAVIAACE